MDTSEFFGKENVGKILMKLAPPVMLAQLIQALYNITDSFFIGKYSQSALTALSIIYPLQLLMIALAVGTGVGVNTAMAAKYGQGESREADRYAGVGTPLSVPSFSGCSLPSSASFSCRHTPICRQTRRRSHAASYHTDV